MVLLTTARQVVATLQSPNGASGSDSDWVEVAEVDDTLDGVASAG